jgi:hypothetical protein
LEKGEVRKMLNVGNVVTGLMMLAGSVVREQGQGYEDMVWRREAQGTVSEARQGETDSTVTVVAGPPIGTVSSSSGADVEAMSIDDDDADVGEVIPGDWDVACTRKRGSRLVFDRESVRELGSGTLFRWSAPAGPMPEISDPIYTGVADCRAKSVEASWPGKRTQTRAGTCGRFLVEAVCAAAGH